MSLIRRHCRTVSVDILDTYPNNHNTVSFHQLSLNREILCEIFFYYCNNFKWLDYYTSPLQCNIMTICKNKISKTSNQGKQSNNSKDACICVNVIPLLTVKPKMLLYDYGNTFKIKLTGILDLRRCQEMCSENKKL